MNGSAETTLLTDQRLAAAALQGDRHAFGELVCRHRQGAVNVVYRMCGDKDIAEAAAQEAFLQAWQRLGQYRPSLSFRNWIYRIAVNLAIDELRRTPAQVSLEEDRLPAQQGLPEAEFEARTRQQAVRRAVLALPPASRAVLVLREYEGLSYKEISEALGIPTGTVMSRLNYARSQLRQELSAYMESE